MVLVKVKVSALHVCQYTQTYAPCQAKSAPQLNIFQGLYCDLHLKLRQKGKTQAEAAAMVGVSQQTLSDWEAGNDTESGKASTPDCRTSIGKKECEPAKGVGAGAFGA